MFADRFPLFNQSAPSHEEKIQNNEESGHLRKPLIAILSAKAVSFKPL